MAKLSYWERRQAEDMVMYIQSADDTANEIARFYMAAADYLSYQTDEVYEKYRSKHGLSDADAIQLLNTMQDQSSMDELLAKLKESNSSEERKELIKTLEAPAYQFRIEHFQELNHQLDQVMESIYHQEIKANTSHYAELAQDAYYRGTYTIQKGTGVVYSFGAVDADAIESLMQSRWSGKNYSERIWKNTDALAQDLKAEIMLHFITGKTNQEIAKVIQEKFAVGANAARRLVWTETSYVANEMNAKAYKEAGIERYRFCAVLDLRTSEVCRNLDGQVFELSERKVGTNYPPMHPYCRSTTIAVISDEDIAKLKRSSRDPVTHKPITVPDNMTYKEWYDRYVKSKPEALLEEKKIKNRSSDRTQWKKYQKILGDNVPDTLDKFQDMKYNEAEKWAELKENKQAALNKKDFSEISQLKGRLGNGEVRRWYKTKDMAIPEKLDKSLPLREQAMQAHELRNTYRTQARELMKDQIARKQLDQNHPNTSFEEMIEHKMKKYGLNEQEAYQDIIRSSTTTNKKYDKIAGVQEGDVSQ